MEAASISVLHKNAAGRAQDGSLTNASVSNFDQSLRVRILRLSHGSRAMHLPVDLKLQSRLVLCIDDNQDVLECEKAFLEDSGFTVLTAPGGNKGLELASIHPVDVVIVDYVMPEMNGEEVALAIRRLRPQVPIIMLSGAVDVSEQALRSVDIFIAKDRLASQLLPAIGQLQDGSSTREAAS